MVIDELSNWCTSDLSHPHTGSIKRSPRFWYSVPFCGMLFTQGLSDKICYILTACVWRTWNRQVILTVWTVCPLNERQTFCCTKFIMWIVELLLLIEQYNVQSWNKGEKQTIKCTYLWMTDIHFFFPRKMLLPYAWITLAFKGTSFF